MGPFEYHDCTQPLKSSVPLPPAHYFDNIDPQPGPVITTEIASGRFEDDIRRMRMAAHHGADHIMVIRTEEGERVAHSINLQSKSLFDSPVYYLQQNDVVYVKPRGLRQSTTMTAIMSAFTPIVTIGSTLSTLILLLTRL